MQTAVWRYWPRCAALHPASGGRVTDRRLILEVTVRERLAAAVLDDETFPVLFDGPGRREAAGRAKFWRRLGHALGQPKRMQYQTRNSHFRV